jgi:hypothetical protein
LGKWAQIIAGCYNSVLQQGYPPPHSMDIFGAPAMSLRSTAAISLAGAIFLLFAPADATH